MDREEKLVMEIKRLTNALENALVYISIAKNDSHCLDACAVRPDVFITSCRDGIDTQAERLNAR